MDNLEWRVKEIERRMREDYVTHDQLRADYPSRRDLIAGRVSRREWPMLALVLANSAAAVAYTLHALLS